MQTKEHALSIIVVSRIQPLQRGVLYSFLPKTVFSIVQNRQVWFEFFQTSALLWYAPSR